MGDLTTVTRPLLGTAVTITLVNDSGNSEVLLSEAFGEIEKVQAELSIYDPDSELSRLNRSAAHDRFRAGDDLFKLIDLSINVSKMTEGAFDITFASAGRLWDFSPDEFNPPGKAAVKRVLPLISYRNIFLDRSSGTVKFLKDGTKIGLGGIAKGYAVSRAVRALRARNVKGAIVACAGDIQVIKNNRGKPWKAGIRDPRGDSVIGTLEMFDGDAVSTSGDYERFRIVNGRRYHHIIDPSTGYPADSGLISVSVFSGDPVMCDACSTAFFILGADKTRRLLKDLKSLMVVLVGSDMKVYASAGLKGRIEFRNDLVVEYF
ncbi:MAG: FAD:protein FMN transferase [Spirochaetes bacterium]|nr:FAD:protein FMN transferase [Spirochaetota bacterium]